MKYLFFSIASLLLFSCNKQKIGGIAISVDIDIAVKNSSGQNLFVETTPNYIKKESIELIYLINGNKSTVYNPNLDCPRNVCDIQDIDGSNLVRVFPNTDHGDEYPITYIKWTDQDTDTLKCHFYRANEGNTVICDRVWLNGVSVYPENAVAGKSRGFTVIK